MAILILIESEFCQYEAIILDLKIWLENFYICNRQILYNNII